MLVAAVVEPAAAGLLLAGLYAAVRSAAVPVLTVLVPTDSGLAELWSIKMFTQIKNVLRRFYDH